MEQIIGSPFLETKFLDNLNFAGLKELWNALITDYTFDEFINDFSEIDNEDDLIKDIKERLKDEIYDREEERKKRTAKNLWNN